MAGTKIRFGIDVGGTFTDFALTTENGIRFLKLPTSTRAPELTIFEGIGRLLGENGLQPRDVESIVHGTTLATNAIISRTGARTALITTKGFRDVLAMGDEGRFDTYDIDLVKPEPLVPRWWRFGVEERLAADGEELLPLDEKALEDIIPALREEKIESLAIGFLHSHVNGSHERHARDVIRAALPNLPISLSSEISPQIGEYERFSTTVANAYVQPLIADYLGRLRTGLADAGLTAPIFLFLSNGGLSDLETARRAPIRLVESGPAGGAVFAGALSKRLDLDEIVAFDMGGTTAKICLIDKGIPRRADSFEMARQHMHKRGSGLPARIPVVDLVEIGAGGGSIARVDKLRRLHVGPESAGSTPGPACYGRGGRNATVTDANLALGRLAADDFEGTGLAVTTAWAKTAINKTVGESLGLDGLSGAAAISAVVEEQMAAAAREHGREKGLDLSRRTLVAFGGSAPLHAVAVAAKLGIDRVVIPAAAGVGSAIGFLQADAVFEISRSLAFPLEAFDAGKVNRAFNQIGREARVAVEKAAPGLEATSQRTMFMRYRGQGHSLAVPVPDSDLDPGDEGALAAKFRDRYREVYKRPLEGVAVECTGISVRLSAGGDDPITGGATGTRPTIPTGRPRVYDADQGDQVPFAVAFRDDLRPDTPFAGPSLIKDYGTTILVPRGYTARRGEHGHVTITKNETGGSGARTSGTGGDGL